MVTGSQTNEEGPGATNNGQDVSVTIDGPISHLWIILDNGPERDYSGTVAVTDIHFTIPVEGLDGDDMINGGDGDDIIEGNGGDDMLTGGEGSDDIFGGDDADIIFGGAGDNVDGGAGGNDHDTLDLTGQGSFIVTGPDGTGEPVADSNGNGLDGKIIFVDANGTPTGETLHFVEIEKIIGDQVEPNEAPTAVDDHFGAGEDNVTDLGNVIDNDSDPDGDTLTIKSVNDQAGNVGEPVAGSNGGLVTINEDGSISFDPNGDFEALGEGETADTTVTYAVQDPDGQMSMATVKITVNGVNDGPVAVDSMYVVSADEDAGDVDANAITDDTGEGADSDPEGDALTVVKVAGSEANVGNAVAGDNGGLFTINADGTVDFDANDDFDGLAVGETASTTVTYMIADEDGLTDTATVTFTVTGTNDAPIAVPDIGATDEDTVIDLDNVLGNDSDPAATAAWTQQL